jgi:hypothetical protein
MSDRDIISMALCGFETGNDSVGQAANIISLAFEKAIYEAATLRDDLAHTDHTFTAGSLAGRLEALDRFISEHMVVTWKQPTQPKLNGAAHAEGSAE